MNSLLLAYLVFLIGRFIWLKEGAPLPGKHLIRALAFFPIVSLALYENLAFAAILSVLFMMPMGIIYLVERKHQASSSAERTITLVIWLPLIFLFGVDLPDPELRLPGFNQLPSEWLALLTAALLCLRESNFAIRWFFRHYKLVEKVKALNEAPSTENGRIIGYLERLLLLLFFWEGAPLAATFIVAVKGLARFKKMEEHQAFAEYVIIGTFLSVLCTALIYKGAQWLY